MRILIIDDDYVSRMKLKSLLSEYGECTLSEDADVGLEKFALAHREKKPFDLVTMDVEMPGIKGPEANAIIRNWEKQHEVFAFDAAKILMITVKTDLKEIMSSFQEGCDEYVVKPITPENIKKALVKIGLLE